MDDPIACYWGKADPHYPGEPKWHPLAYHALDIAACAASLLERHRPWLSALSRLSDLHTDVLQPWLLFLLALHDVGKFGQGFQGLRPDLQLALTGRSVLVPPGERHDTLGYALADRHLLDWLGKDADDPDLLDLIRPWVAAVTGHHGRPPRNPGNTALFMRDHFPEPVLANARSFTVRLADLFLTDGYPLPAPTAGLAERYRTASWLVAGLAVAADWIGSNTRWFPYHAPDRSLAEYWRDVALPQARQAIGESGLGLAEPAEFAGMRALFPALPEATPLQAWASGVSVPGGPQIFVLEELTGSGKTEAALVLAARLMAAGAADGVYLALPTMATADAMFDRVRRGDAWQRLFAEGTAQLALAHSAHWLRLRLEELNRRDAGYGQDEEVTASRHCSAWLADSRKKALLADFGVGTIDQALLAVLPARHQSLRLLGLARKVLIIDEVHACDCYMGELLTRLLRFHAALGGSAVLLSATLPRSQRAGYLRAFAQGARIAGAPPQSTAYPLATHLSGTALSEFAVAPRASVGRRVAVDLLHDDGPVYALLEERTARGRCAVWVRNTVVDAIESWRAWNAAHPDRPATLFHARFALVDRLRIGERLLADFGPRSGPAERAGRLVIATQVVEQSLDVDFDDMVTDLAPIDLVVQRAGRLQRHRRDAAGNPVPAQAADGRGGARIAVLAPRPEGDAGARWLNALLPRSSRVYPDHGKLWLTARWLADEGGFDLPRQARDLVEAVYDEAAFERLPEGLKTVADDADGKCRADRSTARGNVLSFEEGYTPTSFAWQDEGEAPTRLGEPTVRVRLARAADDAILPWAAVDPGIDWALSELTVPRRLIAGESPGDQALLQRARETMSDEGRHAVVIALRPSDGAWRGPALQARNQEVRVTYSPESGLIIERGEQDESDQ